MKHDDALLALLTHAPASLTKRDTQTMIDSFTEAHPDYWLRPVTNAEAAAFMSRTSTSLRQMRYRGTDCGGFFEIDGKGYYPSRLHILNWMRKRGGFSDRVTVTAVPSPTQRNGSSAQLAA